MMEDIAEQVAASQHFGIEFERRGTNRFMYLRYWNDAKLCRVFICRSGFAGVGLTEELGSLSRLLSAISTAPDVVAISGCAVELIRTVDEHPSYPRGVQSCFRFESLDLRVLMHKKNHSVFGQLDMFSVLQSLLVSLGGCLSEDWITESTELVRVSPPYEFNLHNPARGEWQSTSDGTSTLRTICLGNHDLQARSSQDT